MMLPVAILAGGLATRLRPATNKIPKSLIEIAGKPFIFHQLEYLQSQGITSVVLCVGYLGEMIRAAVEDGSNWNIQVNYSFDGENLLGTGGSIRNALPLLGERFFVLYGDSFLPINFLDAQHAFFASGKKCLMTILKNQNQWDKSNVEYRNGQIVEYNKSVSRPQMHYIDYGLGLMQASTLNTYELGQAFDLSKVYNDLSNAGELAGYEVFERFYEIGSHQGILDANAYLMKNM